MGGGVKSDAFADLSRLQLKPGPAEAIATAKPARRKHIAGDFYMAPAEWTERAAATLTTSAQMLVALRLYRRWRMRRGSEAVIAASNAVLGGRMSRWTKYRTLRRLETAGLLKVVKADRGRAPRVEIMG
jgi:hypothetical protein